jgi:hypothetical protein
MDPDQGFLVDRLRMGLGWDSDWLVGEVAVEGSESRLMVHSPDGRDLSFSWSELYASKDPVQFVRDRFAV